VASRPHDILDTERSTLRALMVSRLLLATLFLVASLVLRREHYLLNLFTGVFFLATALVLVRLRRPFVVRIISIGQVVADVAVITGLAALAPEGGGLFVFLYLVPIISASLLFRRVGGLLAAGVSGAAYAGMQIATYFALAPEQRPSGVTQCSYTAGMTFVVFLAVGMLVRQLVEGMHRHGRELSRLRSLHQAILANMNSGLITTDAANRVIYANPAAEAILGRSGTALVGRHIGTFFALRGAEGEFVPFDPAPLRVTGAKRQDEELIGVTEAGEHVPIGYNLSVIPAEHAASHSGKIMLFQDLTDVKELEQRVRQADRLQAVGTMAASIAHEIRNPLASIAGSIELLADSVVLDGRGAKLLRIIMSESDRLNRIIEEFLAYARERPLELAPYNVRSIVDDVATLFATNEAAARGAAVEVHAPDGPLYVLADHDQLTQVFFNLLRNATDAMGDGGRIDIDIEPASTPASAVCVRVRDTGPGMAPDVIERIFEPFFSTKRHGLGIGLALTEKIVRAHHGEINVESAPGRGTTFTVTLPQPEAAAGQPGAASARPSAALETAARGNG
jgi:two-component system sensor histidine kinase PilS (NtrC family)